MTKTRLQMGWMLAIACATVLGIVTALMFSSELVTQADKSDATSQLDLRTLADQSPVLSSNRAFLEGMRQQYASLQTVALEANVDIQIKRDGKDYFGKGTVKYSASGSRYRYEVVLSDDILKLGLLKNVAVAWNGQKYFFYSPANDVLSIQPIEERRYVAAIPNPFFLPLEFLSSNDDSCSGCALRLQDIGTNEKWEPRQQSLRVITSEQSPELTHDLLATSGGVSQTVPFDYVLRIVGQRDGPRQLNSISRTRPDGRRLVDIVFGNFENVHGINHKIPFKTSISAMDTNGALVLLANYTFSKVTLNVPIDDSTFILVPENETRVVEGPGKQ